MNSIRNRLLLALGLCLVVLLVVGGLVVYVRARTALHEGVDRELAARAKLVSGRLALAVKPNSRHRASALGASLFGDAAPNAERRAELLALAKNGFEIRWRETPALAGSYVVRADDGTVIAKSADWPDSDEFDVPAGADAVDRRMPDGRSVRVVHRVVADIPFSNPAWSDAWRRIRGDAPGPRAHVTSVQDLAETEASLASLRRGLIATGLLLPLLSALLIWLVVGRSLKPLEQLRRQVKSLDATTLHQRIDLSQAPRELQPVVESLNASLDRLEQAFERERRSAAHMAHELRTPIAELRALTEVAKQWPDDTALQARCVEQGHEIAEHMSRVVSALLRVTRAESGEATLPQETISLLPRVEVARDQLTSAAESRSQTVHVAPSCEVDVRSDPGVVDTMLANVLQNAIEHAPQGSTIRVSAEVVDGRTVLWVRNPAGEVTPADAEQATEMFWRRDPARTHSELAGLGLPLVKELARAAQVDFHVAVSEGVFGASMAFQTA